jgi:quercetin dioxygenase-like cupin family protein
VEGHAYLRTHSLEAEHLLLDLGEAVTELHGQSSRGQTRGAVTLVKEGGMSVVLSHLHAGGKLQEHAASGAATLQVLDGRVKVHVGNETIEVGAGRLLAFNSGVRHSVEAAEDSTLLLTLTGMKV